jgi:hypothetical protein
MCFGLFAKMADATCSVEACGVLKHLDGFLLQWTPAHGDTVTTSQTSTAANKHTASAAAATPSTQRTKHAAGASDRPHCCRCCPCLPPQNRLMSFGGTKLTGCVSSLALASSRHILMVLSASHVTSLWQHTAARQTETPSAV